jgi:hypothetical protein
MPIGTNPDQASGHVMLGDPGDVILGLRVFTLEQFMVQLSRIMYFHLELLRYRSLPISLVRGSDNKNIGNIYFI